MTSIRKPYNTYTKAFKLEAIWLMEESDKTPSEIAMQLGLRRNQLYKWKDKMIKTGDVPSSRQGRPRKLTKVNLLSCAQKINA